ncbi:hypothetical protein, partial [Oceanivirga salmonicida]|uniref:hypothetical protein n=1 Tax=Oceanivirga salmonicida TaxID=1769291 RepID=UPI0018D25656
SEGISSVNLQRCLQEFNATIVKGWCMFEEDFKYLELMKLFKAFNIDFDFKIKKENEIREKLKFTL